MNNCRRNQRNGNYHQRSHYASAYRMLMVTKYFTRKVLFRQERATRRIRKKARANTNGECSSSYANLKKNPENSRRIFPRKLSKKATARDLKNLKTQCERVEFSDYHLVKRFFRECPHHDQIDHGIHNCETTKRLIAEESRSSNPEGK